MRFDKVNTELKKHEDAICEHGLHFETMATVSSMLIENMNMQMEAEMADLIDRRAMSLFGIQHQTIDKLDV